MNRKFHQQNWNKIQKETRASWKIARGASGTKKGMIKTALDYELIYPTSSGDEKFHNTEDEVLLYDSQHVWTISADCMQLQS